MKAKSVSAVVNSPAISSYSPVGLVWPYKVTSKSNIPVLSYQVCPVGSDPELAPSIRPRIFKNFITVIFL